MPLSPQRREAPCMVHMVRPVSAGGVRSFVCSASACLAHPVGTPLSHGAMDFLTAIVTPEPAPPSELAGLKATEWIGSRLSSQEAVQVSVRRRPRQRHEAS